MSAEAPNQPSGSSAFELLARGVQRQLYRMEWTKLRPVQAETIKAYFQSKDHLVIMAETAGGKTEAAFLPVLSSISEETEGPVRAIYVGPLKALINDQFRRLEDLCTYLEMPVHRWHGDVDAGKKAALVKNPGGVLLITPESLESLFINRTPHLRKLFGGLRAVVIDELHAFLGNERGLHLRSLLTRLHQYVAPGEPEVRLLGLSATIGEPAAAQRYLSPDAPERVRIINSQDGRTELKLCIHGYPLDPSRPESQSKGSTSSGWPNPASSQRVKVGKTNDDADTSEQRVMRRIAADLVNHCYGSSNLIFANAKGDIEIYADMAKEHCRNQGRAEVFMVHHGSLSKEFREDAEERMKAEKDRTIICSSTLEMGIDIGSVRTVGQIGAPWSVNSLKQRLGRSGRRGGEPRRLRMFIKAEETQASEHPIEQLPVDLIQSIAACELMLSGWCEPPSPSTLDLSTLTHQVISTIAERGAAPAVDLHRSLCIQGPFRAVPASLFARLLKQLGSQDVLEQGPDGAIILGLIGEQLRKNKDFYAAFASREEYTLVHGAQPLGTLPVDVVPVPGDHLVFAARRWQVDMVDDARKTIVVIPTRRRQRPRFTGGMGDVHPAVREAMRKVIESNTTFSYLDEPARTMLEGARALGSDHNLARRQVQSTGENRCIIITWAGSRVQRTLSALLAHHGVESTDCDLAMKCQESASRLRVILGEFARDGASTTALATAVPLKQRRKYDRFLSDELLNEGIAADLLDVIGARQLCSAYVG